MIKWGQGDALQAPRRNSLIQGDALATMRGWPDACIDHCIADPPFNMSKRRGLGWAFSSHVTMAESWDRFGEDEFFQFNVEWLREVCRVVKPNGNILVFGTYHNIYQLGFILQSGLNRRVLNSIVWYKPNAQPNITARMLTESTEYIVWAVNGTEAGRDKATNWTFNYRKARELGGDRQHRNVLGRDKRHRVVTLSELQVPVVSKKERAHGKHPSQKPVALMERLVSLYTKPGELILDPFAGSGALAQACIRRARDYVAVERSEEYHAMAERNILSEKRSKVGVIHRWAELRGSPLSEEEILVLDGVPVPQADRLDLVIEVIKIVGDGHNSRTAVADFLASNDRDDYDRRQGAYYADAAYALGWIRPEAQRDSRFVVTDRGREVVKATGPGLRRLVWEDIEGMHFGFVADDLGISLRSGIPDEGAYRGKLADWFDLGDEPGSTADRRTRTILNWIRQLRENEIA